MPFLRKDINKYLSKIKKGDWAYKNILFEATYHYLKPIAWRYVVNKDDVEDVLSEAYLNAFNGIDTYKEKFDGFNWLCKIVQNTAYEINTLNAKFQYCADVYDVQDNIVDIEGLVADRDEIDRLLAPYSEIDRKLIELYYRDKYTLTEIAEKTGVKRSTAYKRLQKICAEIKAKDKKTKK